MRLALATLTALALVLPSAEASSRAQLLMGTVCEITVPSPYEQQLELAFSEAQRIEGFLSTWNEDSELSRVNRGEAAPSPELAALLEVTLNWRDRTGSAFHPAIRPLIDAWATRKGGVRPADGVVAAALEKTRVPFDGTSAERPQYEEGAFGKGYALDRMLAALDVPQVLIDFGGQLSVRGSAMVTVADPQSRHTPVLELTLSDASLSTTSGSEKTFAAGGRQFSHVIDPRSGQALGPRGSVSVVASSGLVADILSTALYVMGEQEGLRWADANAVAAIFINNRNQIRLSDAARAQLRDARVLSRQFTIKDPNQCSE